MDTEDTTRLVVLAHEPGAGWITFAIVGSIEVAERAELDALADGFDAVAIA